jgi:LysR family transcriptional regulator, glycine cleavage system transcriptional activator
MDGRSYPTVTSLRVLAALSQHGTVSAAAISLHLTQSAVSKQLRGIEVIAGMPLFKRTNHGLVPTDAGNIYIEQARVALGALETAAVRVAGLRGSQPAIRIHVLPILGDRWFMPRYPQFVERHRHIEVQFTTFAPTDKVDEADLVCRFGTGKWPGWQADYIFGRDVRLVGSPELIARHGGIAAAGEVARFTILDHPQTPIRWDAFAAEHRLADLKPRQVIRFGYYALVVRGAITGQGLALVPRRLILDELADGRLVNPAGLRFRSKYCYWLTIRDDRRLNTSVRALRDWILAEAAKTESRP